MAEWSKVAVDVGSGLGAGALDQFVQNQDDNRGATTPVPVMKQYGTYLNYFAPAAGVIAVAMGWVRGEMATRIATISGQLAGRKVVHRFTEPGKSGPAPYSPWQRANAAAEEARRRAAEEAARGRIPAGAGSRLEF
jgi:hypothetical protein